MNDGKFDTMSEQEFESMLESGVSQLPPENIVLCVTPWRKAMNQALLGIALFTVTLNFLYLDYILPVIGSIFSLLGFRALRRENSWFGACFIISILRILCLFPVIIINASVFHSAILTEDVLTLMAVFSAALVLLMFFCLWQGLRAVQQKAGLPPRAGGAAALIIWYFLICALALVHYNGLIIPIAMLVGYILILRSIYALSKELDEAGYTIHAAPTRFSGSCIAAVLTVILAAGIACAYIFGGSYPMSWKETEPAEYSGLEDVRTRLLELGFPEYVLNDLSPEDIAACSGALRVVSDVTDEPVNDGRLETTVSYSSSGTRTISQERVYDVRELRITGVGVQLPGQREKWMIFHHFLWIEDPGFCGTECIQLWPVYRDIQEGWTSCGEVSGRVLCGMDGKTFYSPYYFLGNRTFTSSSLFWGARTSTDVFAAFSLPSGAENYRGYIAYPAEELSDGYIISSWFNYTHQSSPFQYPAMTAMEYRMSGGWNKSGVFLTIQDALQFYPTDEDVELIN